MADVFQFQPSLLASSEELLVDVLFAAPAFSAAALVAEAADWAAPFVAVAEAGWTATFDAAAAEAQVVLDEASPHFGAIGRLG